tara:strand:- start:127 stop:1611 length:1485 start_codon:yes stop_codon:yes gene_type:complete
MSVIIHKYAKEVEPIYSVAAGYQSYYPWSKNFQTHTKGSLRRDTMGKKDSQTLYNITSPLGERIGGVNLFNSSPILGFYAGNRVLSERYKDTEAGYLTRKEADELTTSFKSQYGNKGLPILETYLGRTRPDFTGIMAKAIKTANVPAGEEQFRSVGLRKPAKGKYGAQPIDIANAPHFGHIQVTTERLQKNMHHGIYGELGKKLGQNISELKELHHKGIIEKDHMLKEIGKDGLRYFKSRVPTWNTALAAIRKDLMENQKIRPTAKNMASTIRGGDDPVAYLQDMASDAQHFMKKKAATIVLQAIGNLRYFGNSGGGVTYSYAIGPLTHVAIGKFLMNPSTFQFDLAKLNMAEVVDGTYDITDLFIANQSKTMRVMDVAQKRAFAHNSFRGAGVTGITETNALNHLHIGGEFGNSTRLMASIDMFHASKSMHKFITEGLIPEVRKYMKASANKYSSSLLKKHKGSITFANSKQGWALPYISIFDTAYEKTGRVN